MATNANDSLFTFVIIIIKYSPEIHFGIVLNLNLDYKVNLNIYLRFV